MGTALPLHAAFTATVAATAMSCALPGHQRPLSSDERIASGATLELLQAVQVPAGRWSVYFQDGRAGGFGMIDEDRPHCEMQLKRIARRAITIEPTLFRITDIRLGTDSVARQTPPFAMAAPRQAALRARPHVRYVTELQLQGPPSTHVDRLVCAHRDEAGFGLFLGAAQIRAVLGGYFHLHPSVPGGRFGLGASNK